MARPLPPFDAGFLAVVTDPPDPEQLERVRADVQLVLRSYAEGSTQWLFWSGQAAALEAMADR